jgi:TPR repeat protein
MRRFFTALAVLLSMAAFEPARADEAKLSAALDAFEQLTLWRESSGAAGGNLEPTGGIRRWNRELRVRVAGRSSSSELAIVMKYLREATEIAGLRMTLLEGEGTDENFKIEFFPENMAPPVMQAAGCLARTWWAGSGEFTRVELFIRSGSRDFSRCVSHELLHGLGMPAHPHDLNSVMSYTRRGFSDFTEIDKASLRLLYRPEIRPGLFHLPALLAARQVLAAEMALGDPAALARPALDRALQRLRDYVQTGQRNAPAIAAQLGNAYWFGQYVAADRAEGVRFWRMAAEKEHADARYRLGLAARDGSGMARDEAEALRWLGLAAAQNHSTAMLELGRMTRDGRGRAADPVEAHAWLGLAAERNVAGAAAERDALGGRLSPEQLTAARARATQLAPPR